MNTKTSLFDRKELYRMECTSTGQSYKTAMIPQRIRRKVIYDNMHLIDEMTFTTTHSVPQMLPYNGRTDFEIVSFSERKGHPGKNEAISFFIDDYRFRDQLWCNLEYTTFSISHFDYFFTPDFSLWRNLPTEFYNFQNIYRTRFVGLFWQLRGFNVIPTYSFGGLSSFSYCLEGLPSNSIIAVCGLSNRKDQQAYNIWCYALRRLEEEKHPTLILVYGPEIDIPGLHTPVKFLEDFITKRLRYGIDEKQIVGCRC